MDKNPGETVTVEIDVTNHAPDATVITTVVTTQGTIVVTVDPHTIH